MDYKKLDGWKYVCCVADGADIWRMKRMLTAKYKGLSIRFDPIEYELNVLAETIVKDAVYISVYEFLGKHDLRHQKAILEVGLDYYIRMKEAGTENAKCGLKQD